MKAPEITREHFLKATGREPEDDDLERANCPKAGRPGHSACGWDEEMDLPTFDAIVARQRESIPG